jgi:[ribosomal protein S5]-alanine N-acetyltransferase
MIDLPEIRSPRLILREVSPALVSQLFEGYTHQEISEALGFQHQAEWELFQLRYQRYQLHNHRISYCNWLLADPATGWLIGDCGFHTWWRQHRFAEMSYAIWDEDRRRQGLASEAIATVLPIGFGPMGLERVEAFVNPENEASIHLLRKFGFKEEGLLHSRFYNGVDMQDTLVFALLRQDFSGFSL